MIYYIYLFKDDRNNYKIGIARSPNLRLDEVKYHNPTTKLLLCLGIAGNSHATLREFARKREVELHEKFKEKRIFGEWFKLTKKDIVRIWKFFGRHQQPSVGKFIDFEMALEIFDKKNDGEKLPIREVPGKNLPGKLKI